MGAHIDSNGQFQSDKYPGCPAGKVPLSVKDKSAQDLLWEYARRRRWVDVEFGDDLEAALLAEGYKPRRALSKRWWLLGAIALVVLLLAALWGLLEAVDHQRSTLDRRFDHACTAALAAAGFDPANGVEGPTYDLVCEPIYMEMHVKPPLADSCAVFFGSAFLPGSHPQNDAWPACRAVFPLWFWEREAEVSILRNYETSASLTGRGAVDSLGR